MNISENTPCSPVNTNKLTENQQCSICIEDFNGRDTAIVQTRCGHLFDLKCFATSFVTQAINQRKCAICRQDPIPTLDLTTNETYHNDFFPDQAFFDACIKGDKDALNAYVSKDIYIDVTTTTADRSTGLLLAAQHGKLEIVKILLEKKADINATDSNEGETPLMRACLNKHIDIIELLLNHNANINIKDNNGWNALMIACAKGHEKIAQTLINSHAEVNAQNLKGYTALMLACAKGHEKIVQTLINSHAEVNARNSKGYTALMIACEKGHEKTVQTLINSHAEVNAQDSKGQTAVILACVGGHEKIVQTLINSHPEVTAQALHYADLQQSKEDLINFVRRNMHPLFGSIPGAGLLDSVRFLRVMLSLCESSYQDAFPKNIIGVGSGKGFLEKCFELMGEVKVKCYDRDPLNDFVPVEQAEFPKDIEKCLPDDCSNYVLVSGYPQGFLGPVLSEFIRRGGEMLCITVEAGLFCNMHAEFEDNSDVLNEALKALRKKNGEFFQVKLRDYSRIAPPSYIQFYNWPSSVKQSMFESQELKSLCSDIDS